MTPSLKVGIVLEFGLGILAVILGYFFKYPVAKDIHLSWQDLGISLLGVLPPLVLLWLSFQSTHGPLSEIKELIHSHLLPLISKASWGGLFLLALAAGVGEELLFRGLLQGILSEAYGMYFGWFVASLLFGLVHFISPAYVIVTCVMGIYLGGIWLLSGNLLIPMLVHFLYDFLALIAYKKVFSAPSQTSL